jgi:nicotinate-nucleotide pyrophosphorylase (carboxylating)
MPKLSNIVERALAEDVGPGDITSVALVPEDARATAVIVQKKPGVIFGFDAVAETLRQCGAGELVPLCEEGVWIEEESPVEIAQFEGGARELLAAERTALNLLGRLSGIATLTARYVEAVKGTTAHILDTRKTTPGLRSLEKQAVAAGGGLNHRVGLYDAILIKENHIAIAGNVAEAVTLARATLPKLPVEVECRNLTEVEEALAVGVDRILLDNMKLEDLTEAVALRDALDRAIRLEASGGVNLGNVREVAETGVDLISVGALTHSAPVLDVSMLIEPVMGSGPINQDPFIKPAT